MPYKVVMPPLCPCGGSPGSAVDRCLRRRRRWRRYRRARSTCRSRQSPLPAVAELPGRIVALAGQPEGLVWDSVTGTIAAAVRNPDGVVLVDAATGSERARIPLGGAARHLQLVAEGGPLLVPSEEDDRLYRLDLPSGAISAEVPVGRQPHDAAPAAGGRVFVGDELADTVHVVAPTGPPQSSARPSSPVGWHRPPTARWWW